MELQETSREMNSPIIDIEDLLNVSYVSNTDKIRIYIYYFDFLLKRILMSIVIFLVP